jgi:hypothetical protein
MTLPKANGPLWPWQEEDVNQDSQLETLTTQLAQNVHRLNDVVVNVKDFKCSDGQYVQGDGIHDDRTGIQAAINSLTNGGTVFFPEGTYLIKSLYDDTSDPTGYARRREDGIKLTKSNITFEGNNATLHADANCAFIFTQQLGVAVTSDSQSIKNITIRNLNFERENQTFQAKFQFYHLIQMENCINFTVENCKFNGWIGDAICLGTLWSLWNGTIQPIDDWYQTIVRNVRIINCDFDGINKQNRQAISIVCGEDIIIDNCHFKNTTANGMPGAIDVEPDRAYEYANNIHISNCTFENIGQSGTAAAVTFAMNTVLTQLPTTFSVKNCVFDGCYRAYEVLGLQTTDEETIDPNSPSDFTFSGNTIKNGAIWFFAGGVKNLTIENENVDSLTDPSWIASRNNDPNNLPIEGFYLSNNKVKNYIITSDPKYAPIYIGASILGGSIDNNKFFDCGTKYNDSSYGLFRVFYTNYTKHKNMYYGDNTFINTGKYAFTNGDTYIFRVDTALSYGSTILVKDNEQVNIITLKTTDNDLYKYAKIRGSQGVISENTNYNTPSAYDDTTLPDSLPNGITSSANNSITLLTVKPKPNPSYRYMTIQYKYDFSFQTLAFRRPDITTNTWLAWKTVSAT